MLKIKEQGMDKIIAVIVSYNRKKLLKEALEHLLHQQNVKFDILIIDNASTDGTKEYIVDYLQKDNILYHNTGANLGGAGGFSLGVKMGVEKGYDYVWIMDDDTMVTENALDELLKAKEILKGNFGFLCSDVRWIDGSACAMNVPNIDENWIQDSAYLENGIVKVKQCSFVSCFLPSRVVKKVGLPIKEFFIWGDDAEYTKRISLQYPCYFVARSKVIHKMLSNTPTDIVAESSDRLFRYNYAYRNMYYVKKLEGGKLNMLLFYYQTFLEIVRILKSKGKGKGKKIRILCKSMHQRKKFHPEIEYIE